MLQVPARTLHHCSHCHGGDVVVRWFHACNPASVPTYFQKVQALCQLAQPLLNFALAKRTHRGQRDDGAISEGAVLEPPGTSRKFLGHTA